MTFPCTLYRRVHSWCPSTSTCTFLCCAPTTVLLVSTALSPLKQIGNPLGSGKWKFGKFVPDHEKRIRRPGQREGKKIAVFKKSPKMQIYLTSEVVSWYN